MTEELGKKVEPAGEVVKTVEAGEEDKVSLSSEQYNAMLDAIDELNELKSGSRQSAATVDSLVEESRGTLKDPEVTAENLEDIKPADLINFILKEVETKMSRPLMVKIEEMRIGNEIKDLTKDGKNPDFWEHKDLIYKVASRNPNLSIEEAFMLAKTMKSPSDKGTVGERKETLKGLPSRRVIPVGEKSSLPGSSVSTSEPMTRKDAAEMAWSKIEKEGKT